MRIIGIDPGLASTGVGVIDEIDGDTYRFVASGATRTSENQPLPARLEKIHGFVREMIERHRPDAVAVESLFFAKNVRSAVLMAHGRGAAILAASTSGVRVFEYSPLEIKQSVVGKGRASKVQVAQMIMFLLRLKAEPGTDHESDALACALCHAFRMRAKEKLSGGNEGEETDAATAKRRELLRQSFARGRRKRR